MNTLSLEIQNANYWEHFKYEKEIAQIYGADHPTGNNFNLTS